MLSSVDLSFDILNRIWCSQLSSSLMPLDFILQKWPITQRATKEFIFGLFEENRERPVSLLIFVN